MVLYFACFDFGKYGGNMQLYRQDPDNGIEVKAFEIRNGGILT